MALIKFDKRAFIDSLAPGLCSYVVQQFQYTLEEKLNTAVEETYSEMRAQLPKELHAKIIESFSPERMGSDVRVEIDLSGDKKDD